MLDLADDLKRREPGWHDGGSLRGRTVAMSFGGSGFRTRATFEIGIAQLGAFGLDLPAEFGGREPISDIARYLECWVDALVVRTPDHDAVVELALQASVPIVNGMTDQAHPCEVLADAQTLRQRKGDLANLELAFVGAGTNVCASWCHLAARLSLKLTLVCPEGYEVGPDVLAFARSEAGCEVIITHDPEEGVRDADVVCTDGWPRPDGGQTPEERDRRFLPYRVDARLMSLAKEDAILMPCPPITRGQEVTAEVVDGPHWFVGHKAKENLLHTHKAVLLTLLG